MISTNYFITYREPCKMTEKNALELIGKLPYGLSNYIWDFVRPSTKEIFTKEKIRKIVDKFHSFHFYTMIKQIPNNILIQFSKENTVINKYNKLLTLRRFFIKYKNESLYEYIRSTRNCYNCFGPSYSCCFENSGCFNTECLKYFIGKIRYEIRDTMENAINAGNNEGILEIYNNILYICNRFCTLENKERINKLHEYDSNLDVYNTCELLEYMSSDSFE